MTTLTSSESILGRRGSGWLTIAFGTTVAMWAVGYVGRLPAVMLPSPVLAVVMLACVIGGGYIAGRYVDRGWRTAALAGLVTGVLNVLILGSLLTGDLPNRIVPSAALWLPGSILASAVLGAIGGAIGAHRFRRESAAVDWPAMFVRVTVAATFLLLAVGGLVTSKEAGLAVIDWPNSYGYNMFLYPLSRMSGGVYYEHAHRLFGALVGLTTLVMAVVLQRHDPRRWVRRLGWLAFVMVVIQGVLGGLRVTGRFTMSINPEDVAPSIGLAVIHGVFGQMFFGLVVALAVVTSRPWDSGELKSRASDPSTDRTIGTTLVALLLLQLILGALQRHMSSLLLFHITLACIVAPLAIGMGLRMWGVNGSVPVLRRLGAALMWITAIQVVLGIGAFVATAVHGLGVISPLLDVTVATAHQWFGALLLACSAATMVLCYRR